MNIAINTSTISGQNVPLLDEISLAADVGYTGIEPWVRELDAFVADGNPLSDVRNHAEDNNVTIVNLIGFFEWLQDDDDRRQAGLDEARRNFQLAAELHCPWVAAPPMGMTDKENLNPDIAAERFTELQKVAEDVSNAAGFKVQPLLEFWGHSIAIGTLPEALEVIKHCTGAKLLADTFHMHKKETDPALLSTIPTDTLQVYHINDFPDSPSGPELTDADRVFPGDGSADFATIASALSEINFDGWLSLELFNKDYYTRPARDVLQTGFTKVKSALVQES